MAKPALKAVKRGGSRGGTYDVLIASTGQHVATVSFFKSSSSFRFTLDNYPHHHSKMFGTMKATLDAIEKEVL